MLHIVGNFTLPSKGLGPINIECRIIGMCKLYISFSNETTGWTSCLLLVIGIVLKQERERENDRYMQDQTYVKNKIVHIYPWLVKITNS